MLSRVRVLPVHSVSRLNMEPGIRIISYFIDFIHNVYSRLFSFISKVVCVFLHSLHVFIIKKMLTNLLLLITLFRLVLIENPSSKPRPFTF